MSSVSEYWNMNQENVSRLHPREYETASRLILEQAKQEIIVERFEILREREIGIAAWQQISRSKNDIPDNSPLALLGKSQKERFFRTIIIVVGGFAYFYTPRILLTGIIPDFSIIDDLIIYAGAIFIAFLSEMALTELMTFFDLQSDFNHLISYLFPKTQAGKNDFQILWYDTQLAVIQKVERVTFPKTGFYLIVGLIAAELLMTFWWVSIRSGEDIDGMNILPMFGRSVAPNLLMALSAWLLSSKFPFRRKEHYHGVAKVYERMIYNSNSWGVDNTNTNGRWYYQRESPEPKNEGIFDVDDDNSKSDRSS
jgi:hypothetical protein